jgi:hypothetical protein
MDRLNRWYNFRIRRCVRICLEHSFLIHSRTGSGIRNSWLMERKISPSIMREETLRCQRRVPNRPRADLGQEFGEEDRSAGGLLRRGWGCSGPSWGSEELSGPEHASGPSSRFRTSDVSRTICSLTSPDWTPEARPRRPSRPESVWPIAWWMGSGCSGSLRLCCPGCRIEIVWVGSRPGGVFFCGTLCIYTRPYLYV